MSDRFLAASAALTASAVVGAALVAAAACRSDSGSKVTRSVGREPIENLVENPSGRVPVAEVNGVAIYGDCVQRQAVAHSLSREAALEECTSFELLAQAANDPRYLLLPEVQGPGRQEMVRSFLDKTYPYGSAASLPDALVKQFWKAMSPRRYNRPEFRDIVFCRISLPKGATAEHEEAKKAEAYLRGLYKRLKTKKGLTQDDLFEACYGALELPDEERPYLAAGVEKVELQTFKPTTRARYDAQFRATIFDGPQVPGMVLPPLLTQYGWDLILLTNIIPAVATTFATAEPELRQALFEEAVYEPQRAALFRKWYKPLEQKHAVTRNFEALPTTPSTPGLEAVPLQDSAPDASEGQP